MVYMTTAELRFRYNKMDSEQDRILILADLNGCSRKDIQDIMKIKSVMPKRNRTYVKKSVTNIEDKMFQMYQYKCSDSYIATKLGITRRTVCRWRERNKLPLPYTSKGGNITGERQIWDTLFS